MVTTHNHGDFVYTLDRFVFLVSRTNGMSSSCTNEEDYFTTDNVFE